MCKRACIIVLACVAIWSSCKNEPTQTEQLAAVSPDFLEFYEQFHADSAYHMGHIVFPLQTQPLPDSLGHPRQDGLLEASEWVLHRTPVEGDFVRELDQATETMVEEIMYTKAPQVTGTMGTFRRFAKMGDEWFLIYYSGLVPMQ